MKKFYKICTIMAVVLIAIGSICVISATVMGASLSKVYQEISKQMNKYHTYDKVEAQKSYAYHAANLEQLVIVVGSGNIEVVTGSSDAITLTNYDTSIAFKGNQTKDGKTLTIKQASTGNSFHVFHPKKAILQVPSNLQLKVVNLTLGSGDITMDQLSASLFQAKVGSGDLEIQSLTTNQASIDNGSGDTEITLAGYESDYARNVQVGSGECSIGNDDDIDEHAHNGSHHTTIGNKILNITCGSGDVDIQFQNQ